MNTEPVRAWVRLAIVLGALGAPAAGAQHATVAVAANFSIPMQRLETLFEATTAHEITPVAGSTGQLYAQILSGAPYDALLAADALRPARLAEQGAALPDSRFTYAVGRLVLWTREPALMDGLGLEALQGGFRRLAIANPLLAPYGLAAQQTLQALGLWTALERRIVRGENAGQAFAMVATRNAELGLIALSSVIAYDGTGAAVPVPPHHHDPIRQDAVLLRRGAANPAALEFLVFLQSAAARTVIADAGYALP